jgi:hypothetical protein
MIKLAPIQLERASFHAKNGCSNEMLVFCSILARKSGWGEKSFLGPGKHFFTHGCKNRTWALMQTHIKPA